MQQLLANRYRVLSELGRGGMGTVYRVADTLQDDQEVALKVIQSQETATPELVLRFKEEFRAMVKLRHPNTIAVYDYGQIDDKTRYLTMEVVPGQELTEQSRGRQMPLDEVYGYLIQLLQALGFIHSRLYVHRDIKAENIRIREDGTLKLMDFGLMDQLGIPSSGKISGTPGYLPPEVVKGGTIDASSDLYSVGCLAFEMITGRLPFSGDLVTTIRAHMSDAPPALSDFRRGVPEALERIVRRLLEKDQKLRYQQASEVIADLSDLAGIQVARENLEQKKSYLTSSVLVGRDHELQLLETALLEVRSGKGRSVFVGAPAGVGKSRLVQELVLQAKLADVPVLHGQCLESGMAAYEPLAQALRPVLAMAETEEIERHGPVLAKILPELARQGIRPATALEANREKFRLSETVIAWLQEVSARVPLVLFFDDLHWSDPNTLETFNQCIRELKGHRVLCLATFRNDEAPPDSPLWFTVSEGHTELLKLNPFNLPQVMLLLQAMLREVSITKEFGEFLYNSTAGNAFFLTEVARYLIEEGLLTFKEGTWTFPAHIGSLVLPTSVEATVIRRLGQLSDEARSLARIASVLGRYQDRDMFLKVSQLDEESFFNRLDELIERQFLVKEDSRYTFPHDRVREALYDDIPMGDLEAFHQRAGEYLEAAHQGRLETYTNELAYHFSRGTDSKKGFEYLFRAGELAKAAGVYAHALDFWRQAETILVTLDYPDQETRLVELWWEIALLGYHSAPTIAIEAFEKMLPVLERQGNLDAVCTLLRGLVSVIKRLPEGPKKRILGKMSLIKPYHHKVRKGLMRLVPPPPSWVQRILACYGYLVASYGRNGNPIQGLKYNRRGLELCPFTGLSTEGAIQASAIVCYIQAGHYDRNLQIASEAARILTESEALASAIYMPAYIAVVGVRIAQAFQGVRPNPKDLDEAIRLCELSNDYHHCNTYWSRYAIYYAWSGRHQETLGYIELMDQNCRKLGAPLFPWALYLRAYLMWQRGEHEESQAMIQQILSSPHTEEEGWVNHLLHLLRAQILLETGAAAEAARIFQDAVREGRQRNLGLVIVKGLIGQSEAALAMGDPEAARGYLQEALGLASEGDLHNPLHQAIALRQRGMVQLASSEPEAALASFKEGLAIVSRMTIDNPVEQGRLYRAIAEAHMALGDRQSARDAYRNAATCFHVLENRHLLRPVTRRLEELRAPEEEKGEEFALPLEGQELRRSMLETQWRDKLLTIATTARETDQLYQVALETCMSSLMADAASLYLLDPEPRWVASRTTQGPCSEVPANPTYLAQVRETKEGVVAIDLPDEMAISVRSNLELELPSVAAAPVAVPGHPSAVVYLVRNDIADPFDRTDLADLESFCAVLSRSLEQHHSVSSKMGLDVPADPFAVADPFADEPADPFAVADPFADEEPVAAAPSVLEVEAQETLHRRSLDGMTVESLIERTLRLLLEELELSAAALVAPEGEPRWVSRSDEAPALNAELVGRGRVATAPFCAIDMPSFSEASNLEAELSSVAVAGVPGHGLLYCVRRNLETPLTDAELPAVEDAAVRLGEMLDRLRTRQLPVTPHRD